MAGREARRGLKGEGWMHKFLAIILAGGEGKRLHPLTLERAKPAVPFGGKYRIIDFVLNNFVNSGFYRMKVLTQYKSNSLNDHLLKAWRLSPNLGQYVDPVPPQMRTGKHWFKGTADAVYQNLNIIFDEEPEHVFIFGGDHIYKMDVRQMLDFHLDTGADATICAVPVPVQDSQRYGVIEVDSDWRVIGFEEKPKKPKPMPSDPKMCLASMGNYLFKTEVIINELKKDALKDSSHDFGQTILPQLYGKHRVYVYNFLDNKVPGVEAKEMGYWRDVGTIDSYWQANMDLIAVTPIFNLYNYKWPIRTSNPNYPPAKFVFADEKTKRMGLATDSIVAEGCVVSGGMINSSILFPKVRINSYSHVYESILFEGVTIGRHAKIKRAIIDKGVEIPAGTKIGYNREQDRKRFTVSEGGIVVVPKGMKIR
jgi:glucose-1-phosphate adenylyltransferase